MPLGYKPECARCKTRSTPIWKRLDSTGEVVCWSCLHPPSGRESRSHSSSSSPKTNNGNGNSKVVTRKSARTTRSATRSKQFQPVLTKSYIPKGKGRRGLTKKTPRKTPTATATTTTCNCVFHKGTYMQVGDIVSVIGDDDRTYYAQIRGLMTDQYCEKSAALTWLIPTKASPPPEDGFSAWTYLMGPDEDVARKLECMEFVCHVPHEFFKHRSYPYLAQDQNRKAETNFIWTSIPPIYRHAYMDFNETQYFAQQPNSDEDPEGTLTDMQSGYEDLDDSVQEFSEECVESEEVVDNIATKEVSEDTEKSN